MAFSASGGTQPVAHRSTLGLYEPQACKEASVLGLISPRLLAAKGHVSGQVDAVRGLSPAHLGSGSPGTTLEA